MTLGDERSELGDGDALYAPEAVEHGLVNESDEVAEVILHFGWCPGTRQAGESPRWCRRRPRGESNFRPVCLSPGSKCARCTPRGA